MYQLGGHRPGTRASERDGFCWQAADLVVDGDFNAAERDSLLAEIVVRDADFKSKGAASKRLVKPTNRGSADASGRAGAGAPSGHNGPAGSHKRPRDPDCIGAAPVVGETFILDINCLPELLCLSVRTLVCFAVVAATPSAKARDAETGESVAKQTRVSPP